MFGEAVLNASKPELLITNMYDDWLDTISNFTGFNRTILLMRALHVNAQKSSILLKEASKVGKQAGFVWPKIILEDWMKVEIELRNLILADFAKRTNVNVSSLIQSEIQDIILGMETAEENIIKKQTDEIKRQKIQGSTIIQTVNQTVNEQGEKILVTTITPYEQEKFVSKQDWRAKANSISILYQRASNINTQNVDKNTNPFYEFEKLPSYVIAKDLIQKFIQVSDLKIPVLGYIYGSVQEIE